MILGKIENQQERKYKVYQVGNFIKHKNNDDCNGEDFLFTVIKCSLPKDVSGYIEFNTNYFLVSLNDGDVCCNQFFSSLKDLADFYYDSGDELIKIKTLGDDE